MNAGRIVASNHGAPAFCIHGVRLGHSCYCPDCPQHLRRSFQLRVWEWVCDCFLTFNARTTAQRAFRFGEESNELLQAVGTSRADAHRLVDYVYDRPVGNPAQEFGGVMVTLAALAQSCAISLDSWGEAELTRCIANTEKIRAKDLTKPTHSPLPGVSP